MSTVLGIDFSSKALDLVLLDETTDAAVHHRLPLAGAESYQAALSVRQAIRSVDLDGVYLAAIEAPHAQSYAGARAYGRLETAIALALLPRLTVLRLAPAEWHLVFVKQANARKGEPPIKQQVAARCRQLGFDAVSLDASDAYGIAWAARELNDRAITNAA